MSNGNIRFKGDTLILLNIIIHLSDDVSGVCGITQKHIASHQRAKMAHIVKRVKIFPVYQIEKPLRGNLKFDTLIVVAYVIANIGKIHIRTDQYMCKLLMFFNVFFGNSYGSGQTLHGIGLISLSCECAGKKCYGTAQLEL